MGLVYNPGHYGRGREEEDHTKGNDSAFFNLPKHEISDLKNTNNYIADK
jgi:hypothetical protein